MSVLRLVWVLTLLAAISLFPSSASAATVQCTKFASPSGSDANSGTQAAPFATPQKLADSLTAGQTGCLRGGTYSQSVTVSRGGAAGSPMTIRNYPGELPTVVGRLWITKDAPYVTLEGIYLDGRNAGDIPSPTVNAADVTFRRNEVTNQNTAICFVLGNSEELHYGRAARTVIDRNKIHNCGVLPTANHDHGVYVEASDDARVVNNWIYDNADRGVQHYPDARRTIVANNIIDGNGQGVIFGGSTVFASNDNTVENNAITFSNVSHNVLSDWQGPVGTGNVLRNNCVQGSVRDDEGNGGILTSEGGFTSTGNANANPLYVNRSGKDFRLSASSPCRAKLGATADRIPGPDISAPQTTITSGPSGTTTSTSASFGFTSESGATYECRLDTGSWTACSAPKAYSGLANGAHTFSVRASDEAGNVDATPASRTWTVTASYRDRIMATPGLVSYWRLGEAAGAATAADTKGANAGSYRNGTLLGRPGLITGDSNTAADFDGANDHVLVSDSSSLDITGGLSVEAWLRVDTLPAAGQVRTLLTKSSSSYEFALYDNNGRGSFTLSLGGTTHSVIAPAGTFTPGGRYHFTGTYDGANMRLYVNGSQVAGLARSGAIGASTSDIAIGSSYGTATTDGVLDEIALYNLALPASSVQDHYNAGR